MTPTQASKALLAFDAAAPALGLLELGSIARGMVVADAMVKQAALRLLRVDAVTPGKLLVLVQGGEQEVAEGLARGRELGREAILDSFYLPNADAALAPAIIGALGPREVEALAVVETYSVASAIRSADCALKGAAVNLIRMRLARGLGGKSFYLLSGDLDQLEAAQQTIREALDGAAMLLTTELIPRPHPEFVERIWTS